MRLGEAGDQRRGGDEQDRIALADGGAAERDRQMRLADAGQARQQRRVAVGHPPAGGKLAHLLLVERGLGGEVEAVEVAQGGKVGDLGPHLDAPFVAPTDLAFDKQGHGVAQPRLALRRFVEQAVKLVADGGQPQPGQNVGEGPRGRGS